MDAFESLFGELSEIIFNCIQRKDTKYEIFHGCYDWHSSVHGFWALFKISRTYKLKQECKIHANYAYTRLTSTSTDSSTKSIEIEAKNLLSNPSFEMPYGRAWFLRLVIDFELWCLEQNDASYDAKALRNIGCDVANSIVEYLQVDANMNPEIPEYKNPSWALIQLHDFYAHIGDENGLKSVSELVQIYFAKQIPIPCVDFTMDFSRNQFFSVCGNLLYSIALISSDSSPDLLNLLNKLTENEIEPISNLGGSAHQYGMNWSRGWSLAYLGRKYTKENLIQAAKKHIEQGVTHHYELQSNPNVAEEKKYYLYNHWVPQFMIYCICQVTD